MRQIGNRVATDKRPVNILSTNANPTTTTVTHRAAGGRQEKDIPSPVHVYNTSMGGVDLHDQYRSYYSIGRRSKKWWRCLTWFFCQVAIINAYQLYLAVYSRTPTETKVFTHKEFRIECARWLKTSSKQQRKRKLPERPALVMKGNADHYQTRLMGRKRACYLCKKEKRRAPSGRAVETTINGCTKCQLHLCRGDCFLRFHRQF